MFVGSGRGGLSPTQRAEVLAFAQNWQRDGTGGLVIDRPVGGTNERAAVDTLRQVVVDHRAGAGVPNSYGIGIRPYPIPARRLRRYGSIIRRSSRRPVPVACGRTTSVPPTTSHFENKPYWNFGCATQRNLASQVANPADLVQPRAEGPLYRQAHLRRRQVAQG